MTTRTTSLLAWLLTVIAFLPSAIDAADRRSASQRDQADEVERARVPQVSRFNMDEMEFIFFEVTDPDGTIRRTKSVRSHVYKVINVEYSGMPLALGDSIQFFYYPSLTNISVGEMGEKTGPVRDLFTFPNVGAYRLRVVYHARLEYVD